MKPRMNQDYLLRKAKAFAAKNSTASVVDVFMAAWRMCETANGILDFKDDEGTQKQCTRCGRYRNIGNFYRANEYASGLDIYCKDCRKELNINYRIRKGL